MTVAAASVLPRRAHSVPAAPLSAARLLRIELRRSPMPLILPLIGALYWFDSYRPSTSQPPIWVLRTFWNLGQGHTIIDFAPFVAAVAAWIGSRDARRDAVDLITATSRPRLVPQLTSWAATAIWAVGAYLALAGVLFGLYASEGVQGQPPWWPVAVGALAVLAFSAAGFAVGAFLPSRFAAPLAAFGAFLALVFSSQTGFRSTRGWALILPTNSNGNYQASSGVFYPYLPDLPIARLIFLAGVAIAAVGLLGLPARAGGTRLRRVAAVVTVAGVATSALAIGLVETARVGLHGMVIPALHDAASDKPIPYTPACGAAAGTPVCLNPAYGRYLPDVSAALRPVLAEIAGLPGAPARAAQVGGTYSAYEGEAGQTMTIAGHPAVLRMPLDALNSLPASAGFGGITESATQFASVIRLLAVHAFVGAGTGAGTPAQQAVQAALLQDAGVPFASQQKAAAIAGLPGPAGRGHLLHQPRSAGQAMVAAARRFAALPAAARRAWLGAHLAGLRSGAVSRLP